MTGDLLARGARSAVFPPAGGNISQEKWDSIWEEDKPKVEPSLANPLGARASVRNPLAELLTPQ